MSDLLIRAPEEADIKPLTEMINRPAVSWGTGRLPHTRADWIADRVRANNPFVHSVVGSLEGRTIGWGTLSRGRDRASHTGDISLTVHDAFHGQGHGKALLRALLDLADNWIGLTRLELRVYTDNTRAIGLYKAHGFEIEGTCRATNMREGKLVDSHVMGRLKAPPVPGATE